MKKKVLSIFLIACFLTFSLGCTATQTKGAGAGAVLGGMAGALIDKKNPWRGGLIGAAMGLIGGATMVSISEQAAKEAARTNKPVEYRNDNQIVQAIPVAYNPQTKCKAIKNTTWENGKIVSENVQEICEN